MFKKVIFLPLRYSILINLILKIAMFCYVAPWKTNVEQKKILIYDARGYEKLAENLINYHTYASLKDSSYISYYSSGKVPMNALFETDTFRMPAYPTFLALIYYFTGIKPFVAIFIQLFLSVLSIIMVYRITILLFNNKSVSSLASLLFAIDIHSIYNANLLYTDTLFVLWLLISVWYFIRGIQMERLKDICFSGVFMGIACLTRPVGLLYPVIPIVILFVFHKCNLVYKIRSILTYMLVVSVFIGLWSFRNHRQYDSWQLTSQSGCEFLMWDAAITQARLMNEPLTPANLDAIRVLFQKQADSLGFETERNPFGKMAIYNRVAFKYIMQHKNYFMLTHFAGGIKMFFFLGTNKITSMLGWNRKFVRKKIMGWIILLILIFQYGGWIFGIISLSRFRMYLSIAFLLGTILYFIALSGAPGLFVFRYKLPALPFVCIVTAYGYYYLLEKIKKQKADNVNLES